MVNLLRIRGRQTLYMCRPPAAFLAEIIRPAAPTPPMSVRVRSQRRRPTEQQRPVPKVKLPVRFQSGHHRWVVLASTPQYRSLNLQRAAIQQAQPIQAHQQHPGFLTRSLTHVFPLLKLLQVLGPWMLSANLLIGQDNGSPRLPRPQVIQLPIRIINQISGGLSRVHTLQLMRHPSMTA